MPTDVSEKGLEALIVTSLIDEAVYVAGDPKDFDRDHAIDISKLMAFLNATQPEDAERLGIGSDGPNREKFLDRLQGEITKRGVIEMLRKGVDHPAKVQIFYGTPSPGNAKAVALYAAKFSALPGSSVTAKTRPNSRWTFASSSTACPSPPSNSRTA